MTSKKTVYIMRHFQAFHNIPPFDCSIHDPELTVHSQNQATDAIETVKKIPNIDLIACSPLIRTLQTYLLVFNNRQSSLLIIHPDLQEVCSELCDVGSSVDILRTKLPSLLNELNTFEQTFGDVQWRDKINPESIYSPQRIEERAQRFHHWLKNRSEQHIFIISHDLMLRTLFHNEVKTTLKNGEIRAIEYQY